MKESCGRRKIVLAGAEPEKEFEPIYLSLMQESSHVMQVRVTDKEGESKAGGILVAFDIDGDNELVMRRVGSVSKYLNVKLSCAGRIYERGEK